MESILNEYLEHIEGMEETDDYDQRVVYFADEILNMTTYDDGISLEIGKECIEVLSQIVNKTTYNYIEDESNYKKYIVCINLLMSNDEFGSCIDWGSSIRGAWLNPNCYINEVMKFLNYGGQSWSI